jgi:hypothetical protein
VHHPRAQHENDATRWTTGPEIETWEFSASINLFDLIVGGVSGGLMAAGLCRRPVSLLNGILIGLALSLFALSRVAATH